MVIPIKSQDGTTSSNEYDPWIDTNDDGIIDIFDIAALALAFGAEGEPINKTAILTDLQLRVAMLEENVNRTLILRDGEFFTRIRIGGYCEYPAADCWVKFKGWSLTAVYNHSSGGCKVCAYENMLRLVYDSYSIPYGFETDLIMLVSNATVTIELESYHQIIGARIGIGITCLDNGMSWGPIEHVVNTPNTIFTLNASDLR